MVEERRSAHPTSNMRNQDRRTFLQAAAAVTAAGMATGCSGVKNRWRFFSVEEAGTLEAITGWIIPADQDPGAVQADVVQYIDRQLKGHFAEHRKAYQDGLAAANRLAGGSYTAASSSRQQEILHRMERDPELRQFFDLVVTHAMQGFYGSPRHGGNRDFVSWRMLGVPLVPARGRDTRDLPKGGSYAKG
jgi:gluconate 2-dehydrogenase gamma chain